MAEKSPLLRICLLVGSEETKKALEEQLQENLGKHVSILAIAVDMGLKQIPQTDLLIISSIELEEELQAAGLLDKTAPCCTCNRTLNFKEIEQIIELPKGTEVLFVNDSKESSQFCIEDLLGIELDHVRYIPWYPGKKGKVTQEIAITAGESLLVPSEIKRIIDLGPRIIDVPSMLKITELTGMAAGDRRRIIRPYTSKIIEISRKMAMVNAETEVLRNILREKLESKGHIAAYTFADIVGVSQGLSAAKERAAKLAKTDLTVLIEGESGTGKELFASAIHNSSDRKNGPYLAVNFSALPEELLESELFGYEEGAFTGARKGGRTGLFEQADGGTIFLDEIGDITPRMQAKLLRVIQEKEVMPIGGTSIRKVDVRVVSATNKDLKAMVEAGQFRSDLYYRLKMSYVYLQPLRERKEDIEPLVRYFIKSERGDDLFVEPEVFQAFQSHDWEGNVREVYNTVQYMLAVFNGSWLTLEDLPDNRYFGQTADHRKTERIEATVGTGEALSLDEDMVMILRAVAELRKKYGFAGRGRLSSYLTAAGRNLSVSQVRNRLETLEKEGYINSYKGRKGSVLTEKGKMAAR